MPPRTSCCSLLSCSGMAAAALRRNMCTAASASRVPGWDEIVAASQKKQTGISLRYILDFGEQPLARQMLLSARFLQTELPIRLAHRIAELNALPPLLSNNLHVERVKKWYASSFQELQGFPPVKDAADVQQFTRVLRHAYGHRHSSVVPAMAKGVEEYRQKLQQEGALAELPEDLHEFLDRFFLSRIAIRFLAGNHIALMEQAALPESERPQDVIGLIHTKCCPLQVVQDAVASARSVCIQNRGDAPDVHLHGSAGHSIPYVPSHLHHMVFELVKNSLRAVGERYEDASVPPAINVVVACGDEDVTIKVSDEGGGIPRSAMPRIWTYLFTTARSPLPDLPPEDDAYSQLPTVLAGFGCGLPLSRLYARYFGGALQVISMEGYGTDCYLYLNRLGSGEEPLP